MTDRMGDGDASRPDYPAVTVESSRAQIEAGFSPARVRAGLRKRKNWEQLAKFCVVGATGYLVNLAVYAFLLDGLDMHYISAAVGSFLVAVTNNYRGIASGRSGQQRGGVAYQGMRFLDRVDGRAARQPRRPAPARHVGLGEVVAQAIAIVLVTPVNFVGNKLWSFGPRS